MFLKRYGLLAFPGLKDFFIEAAVAELVDAPDSKSGSGNGV